MALLLFAVVAAQGPGQVWDLSSPRPTSLAVILLRGRKKCHFLRPDSGFFHFLSKFLKSASRSRAQRSRRASKVVKGSIKL